MHDSTLASELKSFLSGGVGGCCLVITGHPFEVIKTQLQISNVTALEAIRSATRGGLRSLYAGVAAPLVGVVPIFAVSFASFDAAKAILASGKDPLPLHLIGIAGVLSAIPTTLLLGPGERLKVVAITGGLSTRKALEEILASKNPVRSLFRGSALTLGREGLGSFFYFSTYEALQRTFEEKTLSSIILGGSLAGFAYWLSSMPFDRLKTQTQAKLSGEPLRALPMLADIVRRQGIRGLYKGLGPALVRAIPANSACFLGVEGSRKVLDMMF
jgi:solute carrier family 25 (mitochondrial carnitine/acylcarnitine transporter), member 20/29